MTLTTDQLAAATRYNERERDGGRLTDRHVVALSKGASGAVPFAQRVADFQERHGGLHVDGMAGPRTRAALLTGWLPGRQLKGWRRREPATMIVLHESVTRTAAAALEVLARRDLSVHLVVDRDGLVTQHLPLELAGAHCDGDGVRPKRNGLSIAVEVVNRYYGDKAVGGEDVVEARWAHKGRYILPTPLQLEATWCVVRDLWDRVPSIGQGFPGAPDGRFVWGRHAVGVAGVAAHHRWAHADGLVPEHYCWLRWQGRAASDAYAQTIAAAQGGA